MNELDRTKELNQKLDRIYDKLESFIDVMIRAKAFVESINQNLKNRLYVSFSHGTFTSALRAVLGDKVLISESNKILYRDRIIDNAEPHWFVKSFYLFDAF